MPFSARIDQDFSIDGGPWPDAGARIAKIVRLSNQGEFEEAAQTADGLLVEGVHDIQVLSRCLFGIFLEQGFAALPGLFGALARSLERAAPALDSSNRKRLAEIDGGLVWLCRTLRDRVDFHQAQRDAVFTTWAAECDARRVDAARDALARLKADVERTLPGSRCLEHLAALEAFVDGTLRGLIPRPMPAAAAPPPRPAAPAPPMPPSAAPAAQLAPEPSPKRAETKAAVAKNDDHDSPALRAVKEKIAGFESLMARGEFARAAIVANDINRIVESFDPRVYLPRLFASFYKRLAGGVQDLTPHLQNTDSFSWKALEQLYQVDLHAFLDE